MLQSMESQRSGQDLVTEQQCAVSNSTERNMMFKIKMVVETYTVFRKHSAKCAVICYTLSKSSLETLPTFSHRTCVKGI